MHSAKLIAFALLLFGEISAELAVGALESRLAGRGDLARVGVDNKDYH